MLLWDGTTFSANGSDVVGVMNIAREKKSKLDDETIRDIVTMGNGEGVDRTENSLGGENGRCV